MEVEDEAACSFFASNSELPDIFLTYQDITNDQLVVYGEQGVFLPINDYIDKWGDNFKSHMNIPPTTDLFWKPICLPVTVLYQSVKGTLPGDSCKAVQSGSISFSNISLESDIAAAHTSQSDFV